jgi:hypothetical protein
MYSISPLVGAFYYMLDLTHVEVLAGIMSLYMW